MKTLNTGVQITYDKKGNIKTVVSPYTIDDDANNLTILRYYVKQIRNIIK